MKPKTLTRLLAFGGLCGLGCVHFVPKKFFPFRSRELVAVTAAAVLLAAHRNPLRLLYKDAVAHLPSSWKVRTQEPRRAQTAEHSGSSPQNSG